MSDLEIIYDERWYGEIPEKTMCRNCFSENDWIEWFNENSKEETCPCSYECFFESWDRISFEKFFLRCIDILEEHFKVDKDLNKDTEHQSKYDLARFIETHAGLTSQEIVNDVEKTLRDLSWVER